MLEPFLTQKTVGPLRGTLVGMILSFWPALLYSNIGGKFYEDGR